jgi:ribosomal-protein-alanine N-acetyltransferase
MIYQLNDEYFVRSLTESDLNGSYRQWFEDQDVCRFNGHGKFFKSEDAFRQYITEANKEDRVVWAVCHVQDGHIGNISLQRLSFIHRSAEFTIIMGDRRHWRKGVSLMAGRLLLAHAFNKLNLERIYCGTAASNEGMNKLALALGMKIEGKRRSHVFLEGQRVDVLEYGILRSEFR